MFINSCTNCVPLLFQSGYRPPADGDYVAEAPYRHEELALMAVPDERLHTDTLLEHHHGECFTKAIKRCFVRCKLQSQADQYVQA